MQTMNALQKYIKGDKHFLKFFVGVKYSFAGNKHCLQEMSGKEKDMLEKEAKEKVAKRSTCLEKVRQIQTTNTNTNTIDDINRNTIYYLFTRPKNCAHS